MPDSQCPALPQETIIQDRIHGMMTGSTLGDAIGLYTKFLTKDEAQNAYPSSKPLTKPDFRLKRKDFTPFYRDEYRCHFDLRHWGDATDHALCILDSYVHNRGEIDPIDVAARLVHWRDERKPILDTMPLVARSNDYPVFQWTTFLQDPIQTAYKIWQVDGNDASNGSLMRIHPLGAMCMFDTLDETFEITAENSTVTHADPRCVLACVIHVALIRGLLRGEVTEQEDIDEVFAKAKVWFGGWCARQDDEGKPEYFDRLDETIEKAATFVLDRHFTFAPLELDEAGESRYVFKALGAAIRCLRVAMEWHEQPEREKLKDGQIFKTLITNLNMEAGDANANSCVAGALLGAYLGYEELPAGWRDGGLEFGGWVREMTKLMCEVLEVGGLEMRHCPDMEQYAVEGGGV